MALFRRKKRVDEPEPVVEPLGLPGAPDTDMSGRRSVADHRDYLCSLVRAVPPVAVDIWRAVGLAACEDVRAPHDVPLVSTASIDGYALNSGSTRMAGRPGALVVQVDRRPPNPVMGGTAVRVMAGTLLPPGTDAVVPLDLLDVDGDITLFSPVRRWEGTRLAGSDYASGEVLVRTGTILHPGTVALLAAAGVDEVFVRPRPRLTLLSLGVSAEEREQMLERSDPDGRGGVVILDTTAAVIEAAARDAEIDVRAVPLGSANQEEVARAISEAVATSDIVVTTTDRMVAGQQDPFSEALPGLGATDFARVAMEPGANQGFALVDPDLVPLVVLPAGPGPALVSYLAFVEPLLSKLSGIDEVSEQHAETDRPIARHPTSTTFIPVRLARVGGRPVLSRAGMGDVNHVIDLAMADAIAVVGAGDEPVPTGTPLVCWPLG